MTRINSSVAVRFLTDEHLLAEHREIKRIPKVYKKRLDSKLGFYIPDKFTLGQGHVLFFIDKAAYTLGRYMSLHEECLLRGFNVQDYSENWNVYNTDDNDFIMNDHIPTKEEYEQIRDRICQRITNSTKKSWHYYGKPITIIDAVNLLYNVYSDCYV